jgi:hypothetical protein
MIHFLPCCDCKPPTTATDSDAEKMEGSNRPGKGSQPVSMSLLQLAPQGVVADAEQFGCLGFFPAAEFEHTLDVLFL